MNKKFKAIVKYNDYVVLKDESSELFLLAEKCESSFNIMLKSNNLLVVYNHMTSLILKDIILEEYANSDYEFELDFYELSQVNTSDSWGIFGFNKNI